jgi:replicative DNA helicase
MAKQNTNISVIDYGGKIPPQAVDIEEAILGALMIEKNTIERVTLKPQYFYKDIHQKIFTAISALNDRNKQIDQLTVSEELKRLNLLEEIGGPFYISQLTMKVAGAWNIEQHTQIVFEKFVKREMIRVASEIMSKSFDDTEDTFDILDGAYGEWDKLNNQASEIDEPKPLRQLIKESALGLARRQKLLSEGKTVGIKTPILKLTKWTHGWQGKQLIIIASRPGMGKTAHALANLKSAAMDGKHPCLFSLEMSSVSLTDRILIGESGIDADNYRSGNINQYDWQSFEAASNKLLDLPILIDDKPKSINKIRAMAKSLHRKGRCDMLIIDYLQLSWDDSGEKKSIREQEISNITRKAKLLAVELDIPVILISQLNRAVESRPNKRPILSDLRESGAIEQDADIVLFIYRPDKYGITTDEETGQPLNGRSEIIIEKHRDGQIGTVYFRYNSSITAVYDWDEDWMNQVLNTQTGLTANLEF